MASVQGIWVVAVTRNAYIAKTKLFAGLLDDCGFSRLNRRAYMTDRQTDGQAESLLEDISLRRYSG